MCLRLEWFAGLALLGCVACGAHEREAGVATPEPVAGSEGALGLLIDGSRLFVTTLDRVVSIPLEGGDATELVSLPGFYFFGDLVSDGDNLYWAYEDQNQYPPSWGVMRMPLNGGDALSIPGSMACTGPLAIRGDSLYCGAAVQGGDPGELPLVTELPLAGGTPKVIASSSSGAPVAELRVDSSNLYFHQYQAGVTKAALDGTGATEIVAADPEPGSFALDESSVYYTTFAGDLSKATLDGGAPRRLTRGAGANCCVGTGVLVDGSYVYAELTDAANRAYLVRIPSAGGEAVPMTAPPSSPYRMAIDEHDLYWVDETGGVLHVPK